MSPADALNALQSATNAAAAAAVAYYQDVEFAAQLCGDLAIQLGSNYELSVPLQQACISLQRIVATKSPSTPSTAAISVAVADVEAIWQADGGLQLLRQRIKDADKKQESLLLRQLQDDLPQAAKEREQNSQQLQADEDNARSTAAAETRLLELQLGVDAAQVDQMKDEESRALAAQDFQRAQEANARAKVYAAECSQRVQAAASQRNVQLQEQLLQLRTAARDTAAAAEKRVAAKRAGLEAALSDLLTAANQRLKDCDAMSTNLVAAANQRLKDYDAMSASFSALNARARELLARQPAWPRHKALLRFDLPLQRLTTHFLVSKQWFPRYFSLRGSRLYYSDGKNGYPDTAQGTLAFMQSSPAPDGRYCIDLRGMCAAWRLSLQRLILTPHAQAAVSRVAASLSMGRRSRSRSISHQGTRCISVCMLVLAHRSHSPSRRRGTCASLLPMTSRDSAACVPFKPRAQASPRCRTLRQR